MQNEQRISRDDTRDNSNEDDIDQLTKRISDSARTIMGRMAGDAGSAVGGAVGNAGSAVGNFTANAASNISRTVKRALDRLAELGFIYNFSPALVLEPPNPGASTRPDFRSVPSVLGHNNSPNWPSWLQPVSTEMWQHILNGHSQESTVPDFLQTKFSAENDNIADVIYRTVTTGHRTKNTKLRRHYRKVINGQEIVVIMWRRDSGNGFYIRTAFPQGD